MGFKIKSIRHGGWNYANTYDFKQYFGLNSDEKWPEFAGLPEIIVPLTDGRETKMWLNPRTMPTRIGRFGRLIKSSTHRCYVRCPDCKANVPAGRTTQHKCKERKSA